MRPIYSNVPARPHRLSSGLPGSVLFRAAWVSLAWGLPLAAWAAATNTALPSATNPAAAPPILQDIKGPIAIDSPWNWLGRVLMILIVAGLVALAWWWWRRQHPTTAAAQATLSPAERARKRLQAALGLIDDPDRFVTEVSETTRLYLEERFGLHAPDRTTEEFLGELSASVALDSRHKQLLADFLTRCDLVKFARAIVDRTELEALHGAAHRLVEETAPSELRGPTTPPPLNEPASQP